MRTSSSDVHDQLEKAGLLPFIRSLDGSDGVSLEGTISLFALNKLAGDPRFRSGPLHLMHGEVGAHRVEFRADPGELGKGSLQIVIDKHSGRFHADIDHFSPYTDVVNFMGHAFGEVVPYVFRKLFKRKPKPPQDGDDPG